MSSFNSSSAVLFSFLPRCDYFHCLAVPPSSSSLNHFISHLPHWASNIVNITLYVLLFLAHVERYLSYAKPSICFPFTLSHAICHHSCSLSIPLLLAHDSRRCSRTCEVQSRFKRKSTKLSSLNNMLILARHHQNDCPIASTTAFLSHHYNWDDDIGQKSVYKIST